MKVKKEYIALAVVIVALVLYLVFHETDRTHYQLPDIPEVSDKNISKLEITTSDGTMALNKKDDHWFVGPKAYPADTGFVNDMTEVIGKLAVTALVSESENYTRYNLGGEKKITVKAWSGSTLSRAFDIGKTADTFQHTFIKLSDDPNIYHARGYFRSKFEKPIGDLRDKRVLTFKAEEIKSVEITKDRITTVIEQTEKPSDDKAGNAQASDKAAPPEKAGTKAYEWRTADGKMMPESKMKDLVSYFTEFRCDSYIEDKIKDAFTDPEVTITLKGEKDYTLSLFAKADAEDDTPALSSENPYPFMITKSASEQIDKKIKALLNPEEKK